MFCFVLSFFFLVLFYFVSWSVSNLLNCILSVLKPRTISCYLLSVFVFPFLDGNANYLKVLISQFHLCFCFLVRCFERQKINQLLMQRRCRESLFKTVKLCYCKRCHRFRCQILKLSLSLGNDIFAAITNNRRIGRCYPNQSTEYIVVQLI